MARTTPGRLDNLSFDREDSVFVGDESPNSITSLKNRNRWEFETGQRTPLTMSGTNSSSLNWMVWCGSEAPPEPVGGKAMKVESLKTAPLSSMRTMAPLPPLY